MHNKLCLLCEVSADIYTFKNERRRGRKKEKCFFLFIYLLWKNVNTVMPFSFFIEIFLLVLRRYSNLMQDLSIIMFFNDVCMKRYVSCFSYYITCKMSYIFCESGAEHRIKLMNGLQKT